MSVLRSLRGWTLHLCLSNAEAIKDPKVQKCTSSVNKTRVLQRVACPLRGQTDVPTHRQLRGQLYVWKKSSWRSQSTECFTTVARRLPLLTSDWLPGRMWWRSWGRVRRNEAVRLTESCTKAPQEVCCTSWFAHLFLLQCVCLPALTLSTYGHSLWSIRHSVHFYPALSYCCHPSFSFLPTRFHTTSVALETSHILTYESIPPLPSSLTNSLFSATSDMSSPLRPVTVHPVHSLPGMSSYPQVTEGSDSVLSHWEPGDRCQTASWSRKRE